MSLRNFAVALSLSLVCFLPRAAFADTLKLTGVGGANTDGVYVYPYIFTVTVGSNSTTGVDLSCLSFTREIQINESWDVNTTNLGALLPTSSIDGSSDLALREDAYLDALYDTNVATDSEIQFAIWKVLDNGLTSTNTNGGYDAESAVLYNLAVNAAPNESTPFLNQFTLYTPVTPQGTQNWDNLGEPQEFLRYTPGTPPVPATPEPSSLILMGTGLVGLAGAMRRRLGKA